MTLPFSRFSLLPRRKDSDKRSFGHVLILAGSPGLTGAARLAGESCARSGAGLTTLGVPQGLQGVITRKAIPELMSLGLSQDRSGALSLEAYSRIMAFISARKVNCLAIGPGLSRATGTGRLVRKLVRNSPCPVVLDADGLNSFEGKAVLLKEHRSPLLLTPHRGEFERLFAKAWPERESARAALAKKLSRFYDVLLVLKGHRTLVAEGGNIYINRTGNAGMAKGGSGDVLTGIIAAFIAQGLAPYAAACWAVHFHGKAGDIAVREKSELSLLPSDVIEALPRAFGGRRR